MIKQREKGLTAARKASESPFFIKKSGEKPSESVTAYIEKVFAEHDDLGGAGAVGGADKAQINQPGRVERHCRYAII